MLFIKDGNLYFQNGEDAPIQLTQGGEKSKYHAKLSDDNQKVVFYEDGGDIYSINTNGTQEQIIISNKWMDTLETGTELDNLIFIPHTHILFFETVLCTAKSSVSLCSVSIFFANADTGEIRKLADLGLVQQESSLARNVEISPDGKMVAIGTMEGIKIFTLDGKVIRQNLLPYRPSDSDVLFPSLFWLPDSSGLIVALPDKNISDPFYVDGTAPAYTIWRYMLGNNSTVQIPLDPPVAGYFQVSPNGNSIVYGGISLAATELYLGNLADGSTKAFGNDLMRNFQWSPDSKYFIHGNAVVTSFDKPPEYGGVAPEWIDPNHYVYIVLPSNNSTSQLEKVLIAEIRDDEILYYESGLIHPRFVTIKSQQ